MSTHPRLLLRLARSSGSPTTRYLATKAAPPPPIDPHPFLSQINNPSPSASGSRLSGAGPFPLPPGADREAGIRDAARGWKQLGTGERVGWVANQGSSLVVVLAGGVLAAAVLYSTGTELFATNSPTRIFEDCVERVNESEELKTLLRTPYSFHGENSGNRLRRNRRISHSISTNANGDEVLLLRFYVEGTPLPSEGEDEHIFDTIKKWIGPLIWEDSSKPGSYVPRPTFPKAEPPPVVVPPRTWLGWVTDGIYSAFAGILPPRAQVVDGKLVEAKGMFARIRKPTLGEYDSGEGTAQLIKDPNTNTFVYRQLFVDVPDSRTPGHYRVNIPTNIVEPPAQGLDRLRFWNRSRIASA